jgi:hypothetical protein
MKRTTFVEKLKRLRISEFSEAMMADLTAQAQGIGVYSSLASTSAQ